MAMEEVEIAVVVNDPVGKGEGRAELLAGGIRTVFLSFPCRKLVERVRIARPGPVARSCEAQFGRCVNADEDEA